MREKERERKRENSERNQKKNNYYERRRATPGPFVGGHALFSSIFLYFKRGLGGEEDKRQLALQQSIMAPGDGPSNSASDQPSSRVFKTVDGRLN